jgi:regulator of cell morphogenesis and NO signaling
MSSATITERDAKNNAFENVTVGQLVTQSPGRARVLEGYGLDYCCGGKKLLTEACSEKNLNFATVAAEISAYDATHSAQGTDWANASLSDLADHISTVHHGYLKEELPRIEYLADRVLNAHGAKYEHLTELNEVVHRLSAELQNHTQKEDNVLFPWIKKLETASSRSDLDSSSVSNPIRVMEAEHDEAGAGLEKIKQLTNNYTPPSDTCNTHRVFLSALQELEADLHTHIHKENSILFPRAIARESELHN